MDAETERRIQRERLESLLQEKEAVIGRPSPEVEAWAETVFREADAKAAQAEAAAARARVTPPDWDAEAVRERYAARARRDPGLKDMGAAGHRYVLHPPLPEREVAAFERAHGIRLPIAYRTFLTEVADGGAGPYHGVLRLLVPPSDEDSAAYDVWRASREPGLLSTPFPHTDRCSGPGEGGTGDYPVTGSLPVSELGCGMLVRLVVTGPCAGQVWLDDPVWAGLRREPDGDDFHRWYEG